MTKYETRYSWEIYFLLDNIQSKWFILLMNPFVHCSTPYLRAQIFRKCQLSSSCFAKVFNVFIFFSLFSNHSYMFTGIFIGFFQKSSQRYIKNIILETQKSIFLDNFMRVRVCIRWWLLGRYSSSKPLIH